MPTAAVVSFRLGRPDGVSVVAESWRRALIELGFDVTTVAGVGTADHLVTGLAFDSTEPPSARELEAAINGADVVVVENILTIPLNLAASLVLAHALKGRPTIVHHHDPPWLVAAHRDVTELPIHDEAWRHVVISRRTQREFAERGFTSTVIYNGFDVAPPTAIAPATRRASTWPPTSGCCCTRCGPSPARTSRRAGPRRGRRRHLLAARAGRGRLRPHAGLVARRPRTARVIRTPVRPSRRPGRRLRRGRRGAVPLALGGLRHPADRGGPPPATGRGGRVPGGRRAVGMGFRWLPGDDGGPLEAALADPSCVAGDLEPTGRWRAKHFGHAAMRESLGALLTEVGCPP